ncbi:hypothetical protein HOL21_02810 [Candidatus Woesearchaeota archaeon]|jgi:hypothetical protein|nr:hypothetical protein [Candidatus Woesearchaeota archaeon]MBT5397119.1 hypothetical protein [Candidatus Woesearchaeota archaeon]MBT5924649.1 hypothetical protein [Candidatus Woesearchaeota archaeon]MBT6367335.1 hypothetical protein [Candidatus Woesearchaeota archaeon]MBT7762519.1 hypothetical protein [Candidatus Woesearchaeota archaeon]
MKILLGLVILCILATAVSADINIVEEVVTFDVDYSDFNDEDQETVTSTTSTLTLQNTGSDAVDVTITLTNLPTDYIYTNKIVTVPAAVDGVSGEVSTTLTINVPHEENSGEENVATVALSEGTDTATLRQITESMLKLDNLKVEYTEYKGSSESDNFNDEETFDLQEKVRPFTEMSFTFKIKNLFDSDYDNDKSDLENIELRLEADDDDLFDESFEEDYNFDDLRANDKDELTITFNIDEDAKATDYTFDITLEAEDSDGAKHKIKRDLTFEVERERDDVRITKTVLSPTSLTVCDTAFTMDVGLKNFGSDRQRYAALSIYNVELDINENIETISIDDHGDNDDIWNRLFTFDLPSNTQAKTYSLDVRAYIDNDEVIDIETVDVVVGSCAQDVPEEEEEETVVVTLPSNDTTTGNTETTTTGTTETQETTTVTSAAVIHTIEDPYTTEDFVVAILIVAVILILVLIVAFMIILLK